MRDDLIPLRARLLAVALLSRGAMTAPRALVAYEKIDDGATRPFVTQEVNLETGGRYDGDYVNTPAEAMDDFRARLVRDFERYVARGVPLTEPEWLLGPAGRIAEADALLPTTEGV